MVLSLPSILSVSSSATGRVQKATSSQLLSPDLIMNSDICNSINSDPWLAKDFVKAVKGRLQNKNSRVQLLALTLFETMINNCDDFVYFQVVERGVLQEMVKMVKKTKDTQMREKILLLLDSWQEKFGGLKGKYPQFYNAYAELKRSGVQFPKKEADSAIVIVRSQKTSLPQVGYGLPTSTMERLREVVASETDHFSSTGLDSIRSALELFSTMLQNSNQEEDYKAKKGEVIADLAGQCLANQKKLIHLINSTNNHGLLIEALKLNDKLDIVLAKYAAVPSNSDFPIENKDRRVKQEEEEEDGFSILAKRNTIYKSINGGVSIGISSSNSSEDFSSDTSHALIPIDPPATASSFKNEEDMIQLLDLPTQANQSAQKSYGLPPPANPYRNPFGNAYTLEQNCSYPQPLIHSNVGYLTYHSYTAPWARPAAAKSPWTETDFSSNPFLSTTTYQFSASESSMTVGSARVI